MILTLDIEPHDLKLLLGDMEEFGLDIEYLDLYEQMKKALKNRNRPQLDDFINAPSSMGGDGT